MQLPKPVAADCQTFRIRVHNRKGTPLFFIVLQIPSTLSNFLATSATISTGEFVFIPIHDAQVAITITNFDEFFAAEATT